MLCVAHMYDARAIVYHHFFTTRVCVCVWQVVQPDPDEAGRAEASRDRPPVSAHRHTDAGLALVVIFSFCLNIEIIIKPYIEC